MVHDFARSTVGAKIIMAVTGLGLVSFVLAHMAGNLLIFTRAPDAINACNSGLKDLGPLLWVARIGLIVFAVLHTSLRQTPGTALRVLATLRLNGSRLRSPLYAPLGHRRFRVYCVSSTSLHRGCSDSRPDGLRLATEDARTASCL